MSDKKYLVTEKYVDLDQLFAFEDMSVGEVDDWLEEHEYRERTCQNVGGREGTNGEYYDFECSACGFACDATDAKFCQDCGAKVVE